MRARGDFHSLWIPVVVLSLGWPARGAGQQGGMAEWTPNHPAASAREYAGRTSCAECHPQQSLHQAKSEMGASLQRAMDAALLQERPEMSMVRGPYTYTLMRERERVVLQVQNGVDEMTAPVIAVVGTGEVFQAYLVKQGTHYYRAAVDYYASKARLGLDPEADAAIPATLEGALGKPLTEENVRGCLGCHSPATVTGDGLDETDARPGIQCEVCHGPGAAHAAAARGGKGGEGTIFNPGRMSAEKQQAFCNQCHESAEKMKAENPHGVRSVISPDYRLEESRCWSGMDRRSRCFFCHDPHAPMEKAMDAYDDKCLTCHAAKAGGAVAAEQKGKPCPVGGRNCAGCHMEKVPVVNSAILYTDHRIRVVSAGAAFPE